MNWYLGAFKNYFNFNGRARRKEYWFFTLFHLIFVIAAMVVDNVLGLASDALGYGPVYILYALGSFIPSLSLSVRRLHDIGRSGWWMLLLLIPCIGAIILLVFAVTEGDGQTNTYGPDPKAVESMGGVSY